MNRMVSLWMLTGLAVACCWVAIGLLTGPGGYNLGQSNLVALTAPALLFGRKAPLGMVPFVLLNGFLYMVMGVVVDLIRKQQRRRHA